MGGWRRRLDAHKKKQPYQQGDHASDGGDDIHGSPFAAAISGRFVGPVHFAQLSVVKATSPVMGLALIQAKKHIDNPSVKMFSGLLVNVRLDILLRPTIAIWAVRA
jgi:hypothetical protein